MNEKPAGPLVRSSRRRGPYQIPVVRGYRRMPSTLGGALLGLTGLVLFWAQTSRELSGSWNETIWMGGLSVALFVFVAVLAQFVPPLRGEGRGLRGRKIHKPDLEGWRTVARAFRFTLSEIPLPKASGMVRGVPLRLEFRRRGGARTEASVRLAAPLPGARIFDRAYRTAAEHGASVDRILPTRARKILLDLGDAAVRADGDVATVTVPLFTAAPDRLRDLVLAARAVAG